MTAEENPGTPHWGGRGWETLNDDQFRGRVAGQIDLLIQGQLSVANHLLAIERALGKRDVRAMAIGLGAGALGGAIMALVWLMFRLSVHQ